MIGEVDYDIMFNKKKIIKFDYNDNNGYYEINVN